MPWQGQHWEGLHTPFLASRQLGGQRSLMQRGIMSLRPGGKSWLPRPGCLMHEDALCMRPGHTFLLSCWALSPHAGLGPAGKPAFATAWLCNKNKQAGLRLSREDP